VDARIIEVLQQLPGGVLSVNEIFESVLEQVGSDDGGSDQAPGEDLLQLWQHSLATAVAARSLARATGRALPAEAYTAGLLHDFGKLAVWIAVPLEYQRVLVKCAREGRYPCGVEQELLGADHADIASWLSRSWMMSETLVDAIACHHEPHRASAAARELAAIVNAADWLAWDCGIGSTRLARPPSLDPAIRERLHIDEQRTALIGRELRAEIARAADVFGISALPVDPRGQALRRANEELAQLAARHQQVQAELLRRLEVAEAGAAVDKLTSLHNRRHCVEALDREVSRCNRYRRALSVAFFDIDHFSVFNDKFGQSEGDKLLAEVADMIRGASRAADVVVRYGGEEFVAILPETDLDGALQFAQRVRIDVERFGTRCSDRYGGACVSVSVGVATLEPRQDWVALIERADAALYAAKQAGRNQVRASEVGAAEKMVH